MTRQKSFKTRVRARMEKTGESYAAARHRLLDHTAPAEPEAQSTEPQTQPAEPQAQSTEPKARPVAGVRPLRRSDAPLRERTGRTWDEWFAILDAWGATAHNHTEIARWLVEEHGVDGWWAQTVTGGYEQERGIRVPGQRTDGYFSVSASRTVSVPVDRLFEAFVDAGLRERWLPDVDVRVRTATAPKSFRADWPDGSTRINVGFVPKDGAKAQVAVAHERIADEVEAARLKVYWRDRLTVLKGLLEG
jgi:hypothetical protein